MSRNWQLDHSQLLLEGNTCTYPKIKSIPQKYDGNCENVTFFMKVLLKLLQISLCHSWLTLIVFGCVWSKWMIIAKLYSAYQTNQTVWHVCFNEHNMCSVNSKPSQNSCRRISSFKQASVLLNKWKVNFTIVKSYLPAVLKS